MPEFHRKHFLKDYRFTEWYIHHTEKRQGITGCAVMAVGSDGYRSIRTARRGEAYREIAVQRRGRRKGERPGEFITCVADDPDMRNLLCNGQRRDRLEK